VPDGLARHAAEAGAVRLTRLMMPCSSMWSPSPMWHVCASAVAAARSIWSRQFQIFADLPG
jgi:hypothetical protein